MSLNITNLLYTLQGFYDPNSAGNKYTGTDKDLEYLVSAFGYSGSVVDVELNEGNSFTKSIFENGIKITVSSLTATKISYKVDEETGKITLFGNNITISVDEENTDLIEVVGISNEIVGTTKKDKITLFGYANKVDAGDNEDTVTIYGEDNEIKEAEKNIFKGVGGQYLIYGDKEFFVKANDENGATLDLTKTGETIKLTAENAQITTQDDVADDLELVGNNNYLNAGEGADNISVKGEGNIVVSGGGQDNLIVDGKNNQLVTEAEDIVYHSEKSGNISIAFSDNAQHYVVVKDSIGTEHTILVKRNTSETDAVEVSYEINEKDEIIFTCNNAEIIVGDNSSNLILKGDKNKIISSVGNDTITVIGDENIVVPGEGDDDIYIKGNKNQVSGDDKDVVYHNASNGTITLTADDNSAHYLTVGDYSYFVERHNVTNGDDVNIEYKLKETGVLELKGDYFKLEQQNDGVQDRLKITGSNNYIDTGDADDRIDIKGDNNVVQAGLGDDSVVVDGNNNDIQGDAGKDGIAINGSDNVKDGFEFEDKIYTIKEDEAQTVEIDGKKYTISLTDAAKSSKEEVKIVVQKRNNAIVIEADNVIVTAGVGQQDVIKFIGSNSKIFAQDKDDIIEVYGDKNFIDGWTGNDVISATGLNNKANGFLGDDVINITQRENSDIEVEEALTKIPEKDENDKTYTYEQRVTMAKEVLSVSSANEVDGEFDTDTVNASIKTKISADTEIYTALAQSLVLKPSEDKKKIVVDGRTYTIMNYATTSNNNPFVANRTIQYEVKDVTVKDENGNDVVKKQLVVKGDYISVVADDGQEDAVKLIGNNSYLDLGDENDYLETEGTHNMLFAGIGSDFLKVYGSNNTVHSDKELKESKNDNDVLTVIGDDNTIIGGKGNTDTLYVEGKNVVWQDVEFVSGNFDNRFTLTNDEREKEITVDGDKTYIIKVNIPDDEDLKESVSFDYEYDKTTKTLKIKGDNIQIEAKPGQEDNIILEGNDCVINLGDENDIVDVKGLRNEIYGGLGDDMIKILGDSFKVFAEDGDDKVISNAINSEIYGGMGNNTLDIVNKVGSTNSIEDFKVINDYPNKGVVILTPDIKTGEIKYAINGEDVIFVVQPNIISPQELAGEIFVNYEIKEIEVEKDGKTITVPQLIIEGSNVIIAPPKDTSFEASIYAKLIGSNNRFETSMGDDVVEIEGQQNTVLTHVGQDTVNVKGNKNEIYGDASKDTFDIVGNENNIYGGGGGDNIKLDGQNNVFKVTPEDVAKAGSIILTKKDSPQIINMTINGRVRAYRLSLYNIEKQNIDTTSIKVEYYVDADGFITFNAHNVKIEIIDEEFTQTTDKVTTDNTDSIRLVGNDCYIISGYGHDALKVEGNGNIVDGWYGNDSFEIIGENNEIRGFDGDDIMSITGNKNIIDGEQGNDTLTIIDGEGNKYSNIEKFEENR